MSAINLEKSLERIKQCYIGKNEDNMFVINSKKLNDDLAFKIAMFRINLALENNEITKEDFTNKIAGELNER